MTTDLLSNAHNSLLLAVVLSLIIAGLTKGAIGVGMPIVALPLLALFIDIKAAVILLTIPLILSNIPQALEGGNTAAAARALWPVLAGMVPGLLAGVYFLVNDSLPVATLCAGVALIIVAVIMMISAKIAIPGRYQAPSGIMAGFLGGLLGGTAALPGPIVFTYLIGKGLRGKQFTKEASLFLVISSALLALVLSSSNQVSWTEWAWSLAALVPVGLGMFLGRHIRDRISAENFKRLVLVVVIVSGVGLARKGFTGSWPDVHAHDATAHHTVMPKTHSE